jgi:hypothetical protein
MSAMVKRFQAPRASGTWTTGIRAKGTLGFAAKVIGIGLFAGLVLTYCNALIDACFSGLR